MTSETFVEQLFEALISGDRATARAVVSERLSAGITPSDILVELFWPTFETIERLDRSDKISTLAHHFATRLLRVLVDQNAARLEREPLVGRSVLALSGPGDQGELGAQMAVDLMESGGFSVRYAGGGIATDEIIAHTQETQPDVLVFFATSPGDLPTIRTVIDTLHEIGACPDLQIAVGAGVFNRADGLAEEIGADLWACNPLELAERLIDEPARRAESEQRTVGRNRLRRAA